MRFLAACALFIASALSLRLLHVRVEEKSLAFAARSAPIAAALDAGWEGWSPEAFSRAEDEDRLVILYLTAPWCHACHVLELTTFSDPEVARTIAGRFVPVRVNVEERPDVAARYLTGAIPTVAILTPSGVPLVTETFLTPPALKNLLVHVEHYYRARKDAVEKSALSLERADAGSPGVPRGKPPSPAAELAAMNEVLLYAFDEENGGFGSGGRMPNYAALEYALLALKAPGDERLEKLARLTLGNMTGLSDPEWGGFFRFASSRDWTQPHYEKLLGDNADAASVYLDASRQLGERRYLDAATGALRYARRFLLDPRGGFYASQDADLISGGRLVAGSEYFVLPHRRRIRLGVPRVDASLYAAPNGKMISALAAAFAATGETVFLRTAEKSLGRFIAEGFSRTAGFAHRISPVGAGYFLADQAYMIRALLDVYEATGDPRFLSLAEKAALAALKNFSAPDGALLDTPPPNHAPGLLKKRIRPLASNSVMARNLIRLRYYTGEKKYGTAARNIIVSFSGEWRSFGLDAAPYAAALWMLARHPLEIKIVGPRTHPATRALLRETLAFYDPRKLILVLDPAADAPRLLELKIQPAPRPVLHACVENACAMPVSDPKKVLPALERFASKFMM
ncbi:MAG: DUF255 domain-containing protein [bacterium]